jgi:hypothetical protein
MKKRIFKTTTLAVTVLFAAASISSAAEESPAVPPPKAKEPAALAPSTSLKADTAVPSTAAAVATTDAQKPNEAEMMAKMMELSKLNDNHKLLGTLAGTWTDTVKMWMDPKGNPTESKGTAVRKAIMGGRYYVCDFTGQMQMPGADGKPKNMEFKGMSIEGYDNVKQKFVSTWCDIMGTGIVMSEGTYDAGSKTFTYTGSFEAMPGMTIKLRETLKIVDANHHTFEYFEDRGQGEMKSVEINYTRSSKK